MKFPINIDLNGKVAIVTGGSGVLGSVFSEALALSGAKVAILGRSKESVDAAADMIKNKGGIAIGISADVLDLKSIIEAEKVITSEFGNYDILINGAGGNHPNANTTLEYFEGFNDSDSLSFFDLTIDGFRSVFDLNLIGTLIPTQIFCKKMAANKSGNVINISSMSSFTPLTKVSAYSASKAAINNFTQWLSVHFSKCGIRVNAIAPGFFESKQNAKLLRNEDGSLTDRARKILVGTPMGRFGKAEELIGTLLWLADDNLSSFVTGIIVPVDGGFSAYSGV